MWSKHCSLKKIYTQLLLFSRHESVSHTHTNTDDSCHKGTETGIHIIQFFQCYVAYGRPNLKVWKYCFMAYLLPFFSFILYTAWRKSIASAGNRTLVSGSDLLPVFTTKLLQWPSPKRSVNISSTGGVHSSVINVHSPSWRLKWITVNVSVQFIWM